jgi:ATP-dependent 26S proteasome regulatory subunit
MLNKRNKNKNTDKVFIRSHTDINNYNNFLIELDKKNKDKIPMFTDNPNISPKTNIKNFIKNVNKKFNDSDYKNQHFTGVNILETLIAAIEKRRDPNFYESDEHNFNTKHEYINLSSNSPNKTQFLQPTKKNKVDIEVEINDLNDLIMLIEKYPYDKDTEYNINMSALHKIKEPLIQLNNMIGMKCLKENIIDQIIFYIQNLHSLEVKGNDFMHTVIYGPPGTGKTEIAKIIGSIFSKMGILSKGTFKKVTRADLIAGYLGQTSLKTRDVIKECLGGVLFIDEAYALGNEEKRDSFSKECIDTLCEALSDHKDNLMVIVAGYENELNNCFFNYNQGLNSRFTWRFKTEEYNAEDLYKIFLKKVGDAGWFLDDNSKINVEWFEKNKIHFKSYGRDIENLFAKTKIAHSRRVFCLDSSLKKFITIKDIDKGLEMYLKNEESGKEEKEKLNKIMSSMYV